MAFDSKALVRFGESFKGAATVITLYFFATDHTAAEVAAAGFFNDARSRLKVGDVIITALDIDGTPATRSYVVTAVPASGNVTVATGQAANPAAMSILELTDTPASAGSDNQILKWSSGALVNAADAT